ncbi:MAG: lamin tail domain-containing protein [Chitinophagales bacterium]|nr:lamin tail domain-containing protein [Chitinophagales bacterium]
MARVARLIVLGLWLVSPSVFAQVQDDFSDGDFTNNPAWTGDTPKFEVNAAQQLHLNAPAVSDTAYLVTPSTLAYACEWRFLFILDFSPSSSNYLKAYLLADQQNLKKPLNGYFIRVGKDGSDDRLQLILQQGTSETVLIEGTAGAVSNNYNIVYVKVTRSADGTFSLFADYTGGSGFVAEGSAMDNTVTVGQYFGFFCKYTSTRSDKFYFDDVYAGPPIVDITPPQLLSIKVTSPQSLEVLFSEPLNAATAQQAGNYWLNSPGQTPADAVLDGSNKALVHLTFSQSIPVGPNTLGVSGVADLSGNVLWGAKLDFTFYPPQPGDVLITEIMADPSPPLGLPDAEYVELFNASNVPYDLNGWLFSDRSTIITLSGFVLQPGSYLILCDADYGTLLAPFGPVMTHATFPSLNNSDDLLQLISPYGAVVDAVEYTDDWYQTSPVPSGGISLERIHLLASCTGETNWHASLDSSGGTPGKKNSVSEALADLQPPQLLSATFATPQQVELTFSEPVDSASAALPANHRLEADDGAWLPLQQVIVTPDRRQCSLFLSSAADSNRLYRCVVLNLSDCVGNLNASDTVLLALTPRPQAADVVINEILFNPPKDGSDYVELFNASNKIFDLKNFSIARADDRDSLTSQSRIASLSRLLLPGEYVALTPDPGWVKQQYFTTYPEGIINCKLPTYPDDEGIVVLLFDTMRIDRFRYTDDWHFPLLDNVEGVSLERISPFAPTQDSMNWHSAAATVGYGTPAYRNSQWVLLNGTSQLSISPKVFSPDQDGYQDVLVIQYRLDQPGYVMNIRILDAEGRPVIHLVNNELLDQSGFFTWNGVGADGRTVRMGHYILLAEYFDLQGQVFRERKVFSVAYRKN